VETGFGPRYQIDGEMSSPDHRNPRVRTVWQMDHGQLAPQAHYSLSNYSMIKEHDCVVLTGDLSTEGLKAGDIGTVVHIHGGRKGYEVEFITLAGETVTVVTLLSSQVRPIARREIAHVRALQAA